MVAKTPRPGFTDWATEHSVTPGPPNLTGWLRDHPDIASQARQAHSDGYEPAEIVRWFTEVSGLKANWEQLRRRLADLAREAL